MNILILSCNTGQGHNTAAEAVLEAFERNGHNCRMENALLFLSKIHDDIICDGHVFIYKNFPKLFGVGYRFEENHEPKFIQNQLKLGVKKFGDFVSENSFDAIVCTHVFASILVNEYKKKSGYDCPCAFVSTDYTCHPGAPEGNSDLYFTAHPLLEAEFVNAGVDKDKIFPYGIPVAHKFIKSVSKADARKELELPEDAKIVLIGGGSMGCGPIAKLATLICEKLSDGLVIVACGNNEKLIDQISRLGHSNILPLPYTKRMDLYLSAADLYLTKAGGLSTTETIYKATPLLYINAVPGCETRNIDFMSENSYAAVAFSPEEASELAVSIVNDPKSATENILKCRELLAPDPAEAICKKVEEFVLKKEILNV